MIIQIIYRKFMLIYQFILIPYICLRDSKRYLWKNIRILRIFAWLIPKANIVTNENIMTIENAVTKGSTGKSK